MSRIAVCGILLSSLGISHVMAQNCGGSATSAAMSALDIKKLVSGNYACVGASPNAEWNELHDGNGFSGVVLDWKKGPKDPVDPSDTPTHPTGTYSINGIGSSAATISYTYGSNIYTYIVVNNLGAPLYSFCGSAGGAPNLAVTISTQHC